MKKSTKNLIIASSVAAGVGLLAGAYIFSAKKLIEIALDRKLPKEIEKNKDKISGSSGLSDIAELIKVCSANLESKNLKTVNIQSEDGLNLVGHLYIPENPERIIIAMHGWRSSWSQDFGGIADFWFQNGCAVLFAEQRGQGDSEGEYMGFGMLERHDCLLWVNWVNEHIKRLPIYLAGVSMGATTVLMTAGAELPGRVKGIMADCGFTSPEAIWKHVAESNLHIPYGLYSAIANEICRKKINIKSNDYSSVEALKNAKIPILFIHGTDDTFVPVEMTYENYKACASEKRLLIVPGAEHGMSYLIDKKGYEQTVQSFWSEFDN